MFSFCRSTSYWCGFTDDCDYPYNHHLWMVFVCVLLSSHLLRTTSDQGMYFEFIFALLFCKG